MKGNELDCISAYIEQPSICFHVKTAIHVRDEIVHEDAGDSSDEKSLCLSFPLVRGYLLSLPHISKHLLLVDHEVEN